jgi:hypothetical protein
VAGRKKRINITMDEDLVAAYQRLLPRMGMTFSGFLETMARQSLPAMVQMEATLEEARLAAARGQQLTLEDVKRGLLGPMESGMARLQGEYERFRKTPAEELADQADDDRSMLG